ncbi:hypothetical protein TNCV_2943991 [Trichonephila clavipes]|nr:hypothetical protein TNCV_2943991 [Trichonephila clavipes]
MSMLFLLKSNSKIEGIRHRVTTPPTPDCVEKDLKLLNQPMEGQVCGQIGSALACERNNFEEKNSTLLKRTLVKVVLHMDKAPSRTFKLTAAYLAKEESETRIEVYPI